MALQFLEDLFSGGSRPWEPPFIWEDREIRFDVNPRDLSARRGEIDVEVLDSVEDTKGNNGESGELIVRNLRLIWVSKKQRRTNITIGFNTVTAVNVKDANSRLKGKTQALYVMTKFNNQRFEFIFTAISKSTEGLFATVMAVFKAYDASRLYRDMKLRGALIQEKELKLLPAEQTYSKVNGVWNLSSEQGNLGTFFISNVRVVWFANLSEGFNVSLPYMQIRSVKIRDSKFGQALVLETTEQSGSYVLGFKIDPKETLDYVYKEINSLWQVYARSPSFGVDVTVNPDAQLRSIQVSEQEEDVQIVDASDRADAIASYFADATKGVDRDHVYNAELGLAIEQLKDGLTIEQLWNIL